MKERGDWAGDCPPPPRQGERGIRKIEVIEEMETCRRCGEPIPGEEHTYEDLCHDCYLEEWGEEPEEDEKHDHYSFWKGCPIGWLWDPDWGPFGPRRRR